jgi:23S rRNA (guanosine2251-2'-O)-methyltransferase
MNLICGVNPVLEALASGTRHFDRLLIAKGLRNRRISEAISRASQKAIPLRFETRETLDRMAGGVAHQGLIAVVSPRPASTFEELLEAAREPALFVVLDGVEDPRNLGAILRSAEGAGCDGVLLPERHSAGLGETVNRASAGALEHVRLARIGNVVQALEALKARSVWVVGLDASGTERWDAVDYRRPVALVLGGEGKGIRRLVREHCDHLVSLPLFGHVSSLNVSVVTGVALYEVIRQRGVVPSQVKPIPLKPMAPPQVVGPRPGDGELDPGVHAPGPGEGETDDEGAEVQVIGLHEEDAAWAGPTVLKPVGFRRGRLRPVGRGRGRRDRRRTPGGDERGRPDRRAEPAEAGGDHLVETRSRAGRRGERRRRRRRRGRRGAGPTWPRPQGDPGRGGLPSDGGSAPGPPRVQPEGAPEGTPGPPPGTAGDPSPARRRRRRRRRR